MSRCEGFRTAFNIFINNMKWLIRLETAWSQNHFVPCTPTGAVLSTILYNFIKKLKNAFATIQNGNEFQRKKIRTNSPSLILISLIEL